MSSDEDYMSESFISNIPKKEDLKPGLILNRSAKRAHEMHKQRIERDEKRRKMGSKNTEIERRNEGLQVPITSDNKGFSLLQKMGYKPGMGIGKKESGTIEPVAIAVKNDRFGLGRETVMKEIQELKLKKSLERMKEINASSNLEDYRKRIFEKKREKSTKMDVMKSQKICQHLDMNKDINTPTESWFWPPDDEDEGESDDTDEEVAEEISFEPFEQLKILTDYLRKCHLYCIWCGTHFQNDEDLTSNCPGETKDDH